MPFTGQLATVDAMPGNIELGGPTAIVTAPPPYPGMRFELNLTDNPTLEFPPTGYTDLSYRVRGFSTRRGRSNIVDRIEAGSATVLLDNRDGFLNFGNPGVLLLRRARLRALWDGDYFELFTGHVESYRYSYPGTDKDAVVELVLADGLKVLAQQAFPPSFVREAETAGARVPAVLDTAGIGATARDVNATYIDTHQLAPVRVSEPFSAPFTLASTLVDGSATITVADTSGLAIGMQVTGVGIPIGSTVAGITDGTHFTIQNIANPGNGVARLLRFKDTVYPGVPPPWYELDGISDTTDLSVGMHVGPYYNSDGALLFDHTVTQVLSDRVIVGTPITQTWRGPGNPGGVATNVNFTAAAAQTLTFQKTYLPLANVLDHVREVEATERGLFLVSGRGVYTYQGSGFRPAQSVLLTFGENTGAGEVPYSEVPIAYDDQNVVNEYNIRNVYNDTLTQIVDLTSQGRYFRRSASIDQQWFANYVSLPTDQRIFEPIPRLEGVRLAPRVAEIIPGMDRIALWRKALTADVSSRVSVRRRPLGGSDIFAAYDQFIESVAHDATPNDWRITYVTSPRRT